MYKALKIASILSASLWITACDQAEQKQTQQKAPPSPVSVINVIEQSQAIQVELPGRSRAYLEAEVRPQVSGIITSRGFSEGKDVEAGQSLYQIEPSTYAAALSSAKADLASANATLVAAESTVKRYASLLKTNSISQQDFDVADANYKEALANVEVAKAAIHTAKINLEYTEVRAPISGRIGTSNITPGALVTANQAEILAKIQQLDPINIDIAASSAQLLRLQRNLQDGKLQQSENAEVTLELEDGTTYKHVGKLQFAEVSVDETTGSVVIRAEFPNPDNILLPGMYVRAMLNAGKDPKAILVPQKAITRNTKGQAVAMVVNADNKVESRIVTTAEVINNQWRITEGLKAGDQLIVEGLQKIRVGSDVTPQVLPVSTSTNVE